MIRNQWYAILSSKEVPSKGLIGVERMGEKLALWRPTKDEVACIIDKCCHRGASISAGKVVSKMAQCPFHGFRYDKNGKVKLIPANGKSSTVAERYRVNSYVAKDLYGLIWIYWGKPTDEIPEIPFFDDLKKGFYYTEIKDLWPMHYSRCIENQMDVVHVPFVHHNTIGKGGKTIVYGPKIKWEGSKLIWYVKNLKDDGVIKAKSAKEMEEKEEDLFTLETIMPNIWHNIIGEKVRVFAAFAPVNEENSVLYVRFYQSFLPLWGLRHIVGGVGKIYSKIILNQDKRVVVTQIPKKTSSTMKEKLIPGDRPIAEFRKRRDLLIKENNEEKYGKI